MARPPFRSGSLGHNYLQTRVEATDELAVNRIPDNLPSMLYQASEDNAFLKDPEKKKPLADATIYLLQSLVDPKIAAHYFLPYGAHVSYRGGERLTPRDNVKGFEDDFSGPLSSEVMDIVQKFTAWASEFPIVLVDTPQLIEDLVRAGDSLAEKAREVAAKRFSGSAGNPTPSTSPSASSSPAQLASSLFYPDDQLHRSTYTTGRMSSTINKGLTSPLKRKISALPMESSDLRPTQKCGRRSSSLLASAGPSSSPPAPPPAPEASLEGPREPSPIDATTEVAYVDIYKYGTGCIINITDIIVDALDFALNDLLPLAISGSFNKGIELWAKIGLRAQDQEERHVTEIRRRDQPWEAGTMIARFTYDPTTLDLSRDECFDVHFSDKGQGSYFKMRRSTGTWQGRFPSDMILAENFGVTHYVKVWDPYLPIDHLTKPSRLPPGRSMRCRKYKCGGDNVKFVRRQYVSPLDPEYISSFLPDRPDGDGGAGFHNHGDSDGDDNDDDDSDDGGGEQHKGGRDGHDRNDNDADQGEKKRLRIEKLAADCNNNGEERKALVETRNNKGNAAEKRKANGKGH